MTLHLAPNTPWLLLVVAVLAVAALGLWAYSFAVPPLPQRARRLLPALRILALASLLLLLAQPVIERERSGRPRLVVLEDRSLSMSLPVAAAGEPRSAAAARIVRDVERAWRGRAQVEVLPFAARLGADSAHVGSTASSALGDALDALAGDGSAEPPAGVIVVSDGATNRGADPVDAARRAGVPVHAMLVGSTQVSDRALVDTEPPADARVGRPVTIRVHVTTSEERGVPIGVWLRDGARELARTTIVSPGPGAEALAELRATALSPGLAVWTAGADSSAGELTTRNNAMQVAFPVAPGRLGVTIVTAGLNWDLTFLRRALAADSSLETRTWVRERNGWRRIENRRPGNPGADDLRDAAVLVLDGIAPAEVGGAFEAAVPGFLERGGGVLVLGGGPPGLGRQRGGRLGALLGIDMTPGGGLRGIAPVPDAGARDLLAWDDDPARGEQAWRNAAPLADVMPLAASAGDRVLLRGSGGGPALMVARRVGRGQALLVNGTGLWRWALSGSDELTAERGRKLWRGFVHWLAEPVQAEPLRVRPERWMTPGGEPVRLLATLQDDAFRPVSGATVEAEITGGGRPRRITMTAGSGGSYTTALEGLAPGRYRVSAVARAAGRTLGRSASEFAVDRWSLEEARAVPDSATLAAMSRASGGRPGTVAGAAAWMRSLDLRGLARGRTASLRLWESPWVFAVVVGALSIEWAWRRRRGLP